MSFIYRSTREFYKDSSEEELIEAIESLEGDLDDLDEEGCYSGDQYYQDIACEITYLEEMLEEIREKN